MNVNYVRIPYSAVANTDVTVEDADVQAYIDENKEDLERKATVKLGYVIFDVTASTEDSAEYRKRVNQSC